MMHKSMLLAVLLAPFIMSDAVGDAGYYGTNFVLSAPAAGSPGSTAIAMDDASISGWAGSYTNMVYGADVAAEWKMPARALGPALGTAEDVVSLGRGGQITLVFPNGIRNGAGPDFAVFENSFDDQFLEQAYVEVSSDGTHFVRFPSYSYTLTPVGSFGNVTTELIYGLAGKYRQGYGTPFDLDDLVNAYQAQLAGLTDFSASYASILTNGFPLLDLSRITHVRLIDVVGGGEGLSMDSRGSPIYDPYPTVISAGFDLEAVAVLHAGMMQPESGPVLSVVPTAGFFAFAYTYDSGVLNSGQVQESADLLAWTNCTPNLSGQYTNGSLLTVTNHFSTGMTNRFYRVQFEER